MNHANHEPREVRVMMSNAGRISGPAWLWGTPICAQLNIYRMPTMAAIMSIEVMRQMLVLCNSFHLQTQEGKEELGNCGEVLRFRILLLVRVLKIKLLDENCPSKAF